MKIINYFSFILSKSLVAYECEFEKLVPENKKQLEELNIYPMG